jgi:tetratricopeptide (TPR) repeat protein/predicted Ser/Thr protein kinase
MDTSRYDASEEDGGIEPTIPVEPSSDGPMASGPQPRALDTVELDRGDSLGRYTVLERVGSGGMGVVYAAYDPQLDRRVALKVLHPGRDLEVGTSDGRSRLLREAQAMAKLSHPNVITVHDVGTLGDRVFVAMEFIDGATLREWLKQGHREWAEIVDVFVKAGRGLAAAHAAGLVHRDFKPDNVLVGRDGRVLVMDFGLARQTATSVVETSASGDRPPARPQAHDLVLTRTGALLGTPAYMAPEQHKGAPTDPLADQFSFCVALYEALYGERPFSGTSVTSIALAILEGRVREAPRGSRVPLWLREVVVHGLAVAPEDRHASMDALLAELQRDPPQPRRPWLGIGIAVAVAGSITTAYLVSVPASEDRCRGADASIAQVWNEARREELAQAMDASAGQTESSATVVGGLLDTWSRDWVATHDALCIASRVPGTGPITADDVPELRCLDTMRTELEALTGVLVDPSPDALDRAVWAVQHLPPPSRCADRLRLSKLERSAETPPAILARISGARRDLALGWALASTGQPEPAIEAADAARRIARAVEDRGLEAEIDLITAKAHAVADRAAAAERALRDAVLAAAEGDRAGLEAEAWTEMVDIVGHDLARHGEGLRLGLAADAAITRAGDDPLMRAALDHALGRVLLAEGRWEEARVHLERARRTRARLLPEDHLDLADTLLASGLALDGLARHAEAAARHAEALAILERTLGPRHRRVATALTWLGTAELGAGAPMRADANFARARVILESDDGADAPPDPASLRAIADVLDRAGQVRRADKQLGNAESLHRRALALLDQGALASRRHAGYARLNLGVALGDAGRHVDAAAELREALAILKVELNSTHPDLAVAELDLGHALWALSEHRAAEEAYARALEIWQDTLPEDHPLLGYALTGLGRCALALGEVDTAIEHLERAHEIRDHEDEDKLNLAETSLALARALWATGRDPERALALAGEARELSGAAAPVDEDALRALLDGTDVPAFVDDLVPAALGASDHDPGRAY